MSHIACLCDNDVRENNPDVEHNFVSFALMAAHEEDGAFFELPYGDGEKAEVWLCDECGRAIFFDDGGAMVTRIMRPEKPHPVDMGDPSVRIGYFYNEERFFNDVDECLTREADAGRCPSYEFFDEKYADGAPLLSPSVMRETVFENPDRTFEDWWWGVLSERYLAVFEKEPAESDVPTRLWLLSDEDMVTMTRGARICVACDVLCEHDVLSLKPGKPYEAPKDEYDSEAELIVEKLSREADPQVAAETMAQIFAERYSMPFDAGEFVPVAEEMLEKWRELDSE